MEIRGYKLGSAWVQGGGCRRPITPFAAPDDTLIAPEQEAGPAAYASLMSDKEAESSRQTHRPQHTLSRQKTPLRPHPTPPTDYLSTGRAPVKINDQGNLTLP